MNIGITQTLVQPITSQEAKENKELLKESDLSDTISLAPFWGAFLTHNTTQSLLLQRTVTYFANPVTNYFLNMPFAIIGGCASYAIAKAIIDPENKKNSNDWEAVKKSIGWSTAFTTCAAIGLTELSLQSSSVDLLSKTAMIAVKTILGSSWVDLGFVITSACLSTALLNLADEMFKETPKQPSSTQQK